MESEAPLISSSPQWCFPAARRQHPPLPQFAPPPEIKHQKPQSWYNLCGNCAFLYLISQCTGTRHCTGPAPNLKLHRQYRTPIQGQYRTPHMHPVPGYSIQVNTGHGIARA
eukprot:3562500-Rhodomonas_salina.3